MADYTTLSNVKAQLVETLASSTDSTYDALLSSLITSASRAIDGYMGQDDNYFYPSSDTQVRYYDGNNGQRLDTDHFLNITELAVSEEGLVTPSSYIVWATTDYYFHPYNAPLKGKPYHTILIDSLNGNRHSFPNFYKAVKVTGIFGFSLIPPPEVTQAANVLVIREFQRAKNAFADAGANPVIGQMFYVREVDPDVKRLLAKFVVENL